MNLVKCPNGHFYDSSAHSECPYCNVSSLDMDIDSTVAHTQGNEDNEKNPKENTTPKQEMDFDVGKTMGVYAQQVKESSKQNDPEVSNNEVSKQAPMQVQEWVEPVVGWLVCTQGESKGKDFRLHSERNFVGRDNSNDVIIADDPRVSRKNHATISFNPKKNNFRIFPGDGRGIVYLNDEEVYAVQELNAYDVIEVGETKLTFIPFCGGNFNWEA